MMMTPSLGDLVRGRAPAAVPTPTVGTVRWRDEIPAALVIFVLAVPLCLGIALASGAPLVSGLIAGVIGGILVGMLSGSPLLVTGPAAGLTIVVVSGIEQLGTFESLLLAVILAGGIQIALGLARAGLLAAFFPSSVVRGMIFAIGALLVLKQIPHAVGYDADAMGDDAFFQPNAENTITALLGAFQHIEWGAVLVSGLSLLVLFVWRRTDGGDANRGAGLRALLPAPLLAVLVGVVANFVLTRVAPSLALGPSHLVSLPIPESWGAFVAGVPSPDFSSIGSLAVWRFALVIALVASMETLLAVEATDRLDPYKRVAPLDRELVAQGAGNLTSGLLGGLPMAGVMARTAANIDSGGRTQRATILHGVLLALAALLAPALLNRIPLAAIAAVLIAVGLRLANPAVARTEWRFGRAHGIPFVVTVVAILATDLLIGLLVGLAVGVYYVLLDQLRSDPFTEISPKGAVLRRLVLHRHVTYLHRPALVAELGALRRGARVELDGRQTERIDGDVLTLIHEFHAEAAEKGIDLRLVGIPPRP
jgi:MFS superfamily sulfate permease-like transporter